MRHKVNIKIALLLTCMFLSAFGAKVSAQSSTVYTIKGVSNGRVWQAAVRSGR